MNFVNLPVIVVSWCTIAQPIERSKAIFHFLCLGLRSTSVVVGKKVSWWIFTVKLRFCGDKSIRLTPSASPAAMAQPKLVVSWILDRTLGKFYVETLVQISFIESRGSLIGIPLMSAWSCSRRLFSVIFPSTFSFVRRIPASFFIASITSVIW